MGSPPLAGPAAPWEGLEEDRHWCQMALARGILLHKVEFCSKRHAKLEHLAGVRPPSRPGGLGSAKVSEVLKNDTNHALFTELELQHRDLAELVQ